ncbi:hypothetical protein JT350_gp38 [Salmonella phage SAP012]|uniref:Uncharacterized protein n=1 Tax=Salmonella phage SAP012 TaxID=2742114 RepID=A0A6J4EH27_9CAUD|nr:hypothetical protein JT350_gp38 [Salmonella phage SAP012]BCG45201.1 hypothetical protein [Salmonella phage SAP012]
MAKNDYRTVIATALGAAPRATPEITVGVSTSEVLGKAPGDVRFGVTVVEALQWDGKLPAATTHGVNVMEVLGKLPGEVRFGVAVAEVLLSPVGFAGGLNIVEVLGQSSAQTPAFVDTVYSAVTSGRPVPPVEDVISVESVLSATSYAVTMQPMEPVQSLTQVSTTAMLSVLESPLVTISTETVRQAIVSHTMSADVDWYPQPSDYFSRDIVGQQAVLVLQSLDIPYVPTSGVYAVTNVSLVAQSSPMGRLPRSNVYAAQQLSQVVQPKAEPMPRSYTNVAQQLTQAVIPAVFDDHTVGVEHSGSVTSCAVQEYPLPMHISYQRAGNVFSLVLVNDPDSQSVPLSRTRVGSLTALQLEKSDDLHPQSLTQVSQVHSYAAVGSQTVPPVNMLVWGRADAVFSLVALHADDYPDPNLATGMAIAEEVVCLAAGGAVYESPEDIYDRSRVQQVRTISRLSTSTRPLAMPISYAPVAQLWEYAARSERMPTPEEVLNSGIHIRLITQPIAFAAEYPDATVPYSYLSTGQVMEHVAQVAEYPDVHVPTADAIASQILEHVASPDDFPDPAEMFRPLLVNQVVEHYAAETLYPDANTLHKPVSVWQVAQQVSVSAQYPDKDIPQSWLNVYQVSEQVAVITKYPDKNTPQSTLRADMILEHVMAVDPTMYGMPAPPRKHRVQISCRFVYT